jgi:hypothetical protein
MRYRHVAIIFLILIFPAPLSRAQDNYEIQVYGSDLVDPAHTMVELHNNFTIDGSKTNEKPDCPVAMLVPRKRDKWR